MRRNLNGRWDFYPNDESTRYSIVVPTWWDSLSGTTGYPKEWEQGLYHGVYRKSVEIDEGLLSEDVFLHIGALATLGKVSVNGKSVGPSSTKGYLMTLLPYDLDINDAVIKGNNEIKIEVWSVKELPDDALAPEDGPDRLLFPFGTENIVGRVGIGADVYIESRPKLRIDDLQIIPDLNKNADPSDDELRVNVTVVNGTDVERDLTVSATVFPAADMQTQELSLAAEHVHVQAHGKATVMLGTVWTDAHYWSRADPHLYVLKAQIADTVSVLHEDSDRFGFREFYRVGDSYYLNGVKIRLRGDSLCLLNQGNRDLINEIGDAYGVILDDNHATDAMAKIWIDAYKHANANIIRNHIRSVPSETLFDHADEVGMLIEEETAFWNPGSVSNVSLNPPYYINYSDEAIGYYCEWVERWVQAYRNHPSIVLWSTTNEAWNPNDASELIPPLEHAVSSNDPSRLVINDGFNKPITNEDSRHYFGGYPSGMTSSPDIYSLYQIDSDLPLGAGEEFSVSTAGIPQYAEDGSIKDIYHGRLNGNPDTVSRADFGREVGRVTRGVRTTRMANWKPFCLSMFIYDNIERNIPLDQEATRHGLNPSWLTRPQFDPSAQGDHRWVEGDGYEYFANSYSDVAAFDKAFDKEPRLGLQHSMYQPGTTSTRTIIVHNDEEIDGTELTLNWKVCNLDVHTDERHEFETGSAALHVEYGECIEHEIVIKVPDSDGSRGSKLLLILEVVKDGRRKFIEDNFLGWIGVPAPAKIAASNTHIDLGTVVWSSRSVKHCIHLVQAGGAMTEHWTARVIDDASGSISLERFSGNLRHEQEQFFTVNVAGLVSGRSYRGLIEYTGELGDTVEIAVYFIAGTLPAEDEALNKANGAAVRVSSNSEQPGWVPAALVDGHFEASYNLFGWSSERLPEDRSEWVELKLSQPQRLSQIVLVPRGQNPGGTVAEAFHGEGEGVGGVLEFAAGHKANDPNTGQGFPLDFTISVSADGDSWNIVVSKEDYPLPYNGQARAFDFDPVEDIRYIRLLVTKLRANPNDSNLRALQLVEIAAYGHPHMATVPSAPRDLKSVVNSHDVHISWAFDSDGRSPLLGTTITLSDERGHTISLSADGASTDAIARNVPAGQWTVTVHGRNVIGEGEWAKGEAFRVGRSGANALNGELQTPARPAVELIVESGAVNVTWGETDIHGHGGADTSQASGYNVILAPQDADADSSIAWVPAGDPTSFTFEGLPTGVYTAVIEITDREDRVSPTSPASLPVVVATVPARPNKPGVTSSVNDMEITWQAPADGGTPITSYALTLRNLTENTVSVIKAEAGESSKHVGALAPGNYTASVIAANLIGMSEESSPSLPCLIK